MAWTIPARGGYADGEVAWLRAFCKAAPAGPKQLAQFDRDVSALQTAGEMASMRVVRWAILEAPPTGLAIRRRLVCESPHYVAAVRGHGGAPWRDAALPPPEPISNAKPAFEIEMVIPRVSDVELVAARALEQLAENLAIDTVVTGRLKVALVEACINAFEHAGSADGRVRLMFSAPTGGC